LLGKTASALTELPKKIQRTTWRINRDLKRLAAVDFLKKKSVAVFAKSVAKKFFSFAHKMLLRKRLVEPESSH
jgi:hypothetical protein